MNICYCVERRSGGSIDYTFDNKQEAYDKLNELNNLRLNAVMNEYVRTPDYIFSRPLEENITSASCGCVQTLNFDYIGKIPLVDFESYATQKKQYKRKKQMLIF